MAKNIKKVSSKKQVKPVSAKKKVKKTPKAKGYYFVNDEKKVQIINLASLGMNLTDIAPAVGISRQWIYKVFEKDPIFKKRFDEAKAQRTLETHLFKNRMEGNAKKLLEKSVEKGTEFVSGIEKYDDMSAQSLPKFTKSAIEVLKITNPEQYKEKHEHTIEGEITVDLSDERKEEIDNLKI